MLGTGVSPADYNETQMQGNDHDFPFRLLFENAPAGFALVTHDGRLQLVNASLCNLLGYSQEELADKSINDLTHSQEDFIESDFIIKLRDNDLPFVQVEKRFVHKLGYIVQVILQIGAFRIDTQKKPHFIFQFTDITQYKETNEVIFYQQKMESLGMMAGGISHEYNNLLVGIMGQATIALAKLGETHPVSQHIQKAVNAAKQAAFLTQQMLSYSGHRFLEKQPVNLNGLIQENLPLLQAAISKLIQIDLSLANNLPVVTVDKGQLQQVLMNLILNATEAIGSQPGRVHLITKQLQIQQNGGLKMHEIGHELQPGLYVCLSVCDNGCGMDDETRKKIFDPFFTTKFTGRGLGLAAVKGILEGHKGGIRVFSEVQAGSTFQLYFPVTEVEELEETAVMPQA